MRIKKIVIVLLLQINLSGQITDLETEPYRSLVKLPLKLEGWFPHINQHHMRKILYERAPRIVVELGSYLGLSTVFIASYLPYDSKLYAIDQWKTSGTFQQFLSNCKTYGLSDTIVPIRMSTLEAAAALNIKPDLVYIDAEHDEKSVYDDIQKWYAKLSDGGLLCGDDADCPTVRNALERAAPELNQTVHYDATFWMFNEKK